MLTGVIAATVDTGVVVIVVAVAAVLIVVLVTGSMRGRQRRGDARRIEARHDLVDAEERAQRAEHDRDVALEGEHDRHEDR